MTGHAETVREAQAQLERLKVAVTDHLTALERERDELTAKVEQLNEEVVSAQDYRHKMEVERDEALAKVERYEAALRERPHLPDGVPPVGHYVQHHDLKHCSLCAALAADTKGEETNPEAER